MLRRICQVLPLFALLLMVACESQPETDTPELNVENVQPVPILSQTTGDNQALQNATTELIRDEADLQALGVESLGDLNVDWDQQDVVLVALGEQPTGGYWTRITGIQQDGDELYVQFTANAPAEGQAATQALTYPYAAAVVPETGAEVVLSDPTEVIGQTAPGQ